MNKNDVLTLDIDRLSGDSGIAFYENKTLFVRGALPGERVEARVEKVGKTSAFLKTLDVLTPSPERCAPKCPFFEKCGGCTMQHMSYPAQLNMKRQKISDAFSHIAGLNIEVPEVLGMEAPWHYRNKIALPVAGTADAPQMGYYAPRSHRLVPVDTCLIARETMQSALPALRLWMEKFHIPPYDEATGQGLIRHILCRENQKGECMTVLIATRLSLPHEAELTALLRSEVPALRALLVCENRRRDNVILGTRARTLWGADHLSDTLCGFTYRISPLSFFQVNPVQTEKLYQTALRFADVQKSDRALDLYCGAGTISLLLSQTAGEVLGIEEVEAAVENAKENAALNGVFNASFLTGKAENLLPELCRKGYRPDVAVLDPPRKGCDGKVLAALADAAPRRIVYVSCDVATLARDAKILTASGYRVEKCQGVDMFCQTAHVETVVLMSRDGLRE